MTANRPGSPRPARGARPSRWVQPAEDAPALLDVALGCLIGGAVGDALGAEVEFDSMASIWERFGRHGVTGFPDGHGRLTDDTQMTLFTVDGLIRARLGGDRGLSDTAAGFHRAYLRWLSTQGETVAFDDKSEPSGWLATHPQLQARRAPGNTCLSALRSGKAGDPDEPINDSKGCGGVMRAGPVGLVAPEPFRTGVAAAAVTHNHPSGYLAAGALAEMVARLRRGESLLRGVAAAQRRLVEWRGHPETAAAIDAAVDLATSEPVPTPDTVATLGQGWVAEEALAISLYCALTATDFADGVLAAVNHGGDSDSTGSIAGNLLGARFGPEAIPLEWLEALRERDLVTQVATDLAGAFEGGADEADLARRYPPA